MEGDILRDVAIDLDTMDDMHIAIQVAQALYIAQKHKFMHNDLHMGNITMKYYPTKIKLHYTDPLDYILETHYEVTIFDYDLSSLESRTMNTKLEDDLCKKIGTCNNYTLNYDWDLFLHNYVAEMEYRRSTPLRNILGGVRTQDIGNIYGRQGERSMYGHACVCVENDPHPRCKDPQKCIQCRKCIRDGLIDLMTPKQFIESDQTMVFRQKSNFVPQLQKPKIEMEEQFTFHDINYYVQNYQKNLVHEAVKGGKHTRVKKSSRYHPYKHHKNITDELVELHI